MRLYIFIVKLYLVIKMHQMIEKYENSIKRDEMISWFPVLTLYSED